MNKLISIIFTIGLLIISSNMSEIKRGADVEIEKSIPVTVSVLEPLEVSEEELPIEVEPEVEEPDDRYLGNFKITYYCGCHSCSDDWGTMTATGVTAKEGRTIAVDPKVISYGTKVLINGREYVAEDCGGAIKGNRIDIFMDSHERARKAGVDYFDVYIVS